MIGREQLRALGVTDKQIARQERSGLLHRVHRDVWAVGHRNISNLGRLIAALLSCGPSAFLSHRTAAALGGLRALNVRAIEVTVVAARAPVRHGLIVHRTDREPAADDLRARGLLRFSSVPRTLIELAAREDARELDRLITQAVRRGVYDAAAIEAALRRHARRPGVGRLREAVARYRPAPDRKSELERAFDAWLPRHPEIPEPLRNVQIDGWEIDCWWPQQRLALELDGRPYHVAVRDMDRDRIKDAQLLRLGIRPLRVSDHRFEHDPEGVRSDLCALLELS